MKIELVSWKGFLKRHARLVAIVVVGMLIVFVGALLFVQFNPARNDRVTPTGIRDYVQEYFYEYEYLYNDPSSPWLTFRLQT